MLLQKKNIMAKLVNNLASPSSPASIAALDKFRVLHSSDKLRRLQCCLDSEGYAIVLKSPEDPSKINLESIKENDILSVVNADVLLQYITEAN